MCCRACDERAASVWPVLPCAVERVMSEWLACGRCCRVLLASIVRRCAPPATVTHCSALSATWGLATDTADKVLPPYVPHGAWYIAHVRRGVPTPKPFQEAAFERFTRPVVVVPEGGNGRVISAGANQRGDPANHPAAASAFGAQPLGGWVDLVSSAASAAAGSDPALSPLVSSSGAPAPRQQTRAAASVPAPALAGRRQGRTSSLIPPLPWLWQAARSVQLPHGPACTPLSVTCYIPMDSSSSPTRQRAD